MVTVEIGKLCFKRCNVAEFILCLCVSVYQLSSDLDDSGNPTGEAALKLVRSDYGVTDWGDTDYQTFASNDDNKTVAVFTICNRDAKDGKFEDNFHSGKYHFYR